MRVLMVCLGNICRSPLAEGILRKKVKSHKLDWTVDSAGTGSWHIGASPDPRSIAVAKNHGIDIEQQRGRQLSKRDFENFDLIFAMDSENFQNIMRLAPSEEDKQKVSLIMNQLESKSNQSVPDPYWDDDGFEKVFKMLEKACEKIVDNFASR